MIPFAVSFHYWTETQGERCVAPLGLWFATSTDEVMKQAAAYADRYFPALAIKIVLRVFANDPLGRPIGTIERSLI